MCLDQLDHASVHIDRTPVTKLADQGCAGESLDEGDHAVLVGRADDDVHFPVPGFLAILDAGRPLRNVRLAPKAAAVLGGGVALSIAHGLAEMLPESSALVLVPFDVGVDRLVTDGEDVEKSEPATDLFRAELLTHQRLDKLPLTLAEMSVPTGSRASAIGPLLGFAGAVGPIVPRAVATKLATDGGAVTAGDASHLSVREALAAQQAEGVSFSGGDLGV